MTRLLDAGAHIIGKTAVPAFCFDGGGITGYPEPAADQPARPGATCAARRRTAAPPCWSTGQADLALGGDQGGSIRLPASWSGCCGHKPTYGLVPYTGIFPIELTIDHIGPMARTVADCALMLEAIAGEDGLDPRQIGVAIAGLRRGARASARRACASGVLARGLRHPGRLRARRRRRRPRRRRARSPRAGASVEEVSIPMHRDGLAIWNAIAIEGATDLMVRGDAFGTNHKGHYSTDLVDFYGRARRARAADYSVTVKLTVLLGAYLSERLQPPLLRQGAEPRPPAAAPRYAEALERFDVLVLPDDGDEGAPDPGRARDPRRPRRRARQPAQHVAVRRHRQPGAAASRAGCPTACRSG